MRWKKQQQQKKKKKLRPNFFAKLMVLKEKKVEFGNRRSSYTVHVYFLEA